MSDKGPTLPPAAGVSRGADDPLIAALIVKLPAPGSAWPLAARINWLRMLVMAFNEAYGMADPIVISDTEPVRVERPRGLFVVPQPAEAEQPGPAAPAPAPGAQRYTIDQEGFAMFNGKPIAPEDIPAGAMLWDERTGPEKGDLGAVMWKGEGCRPPDKLPKTLQQQLRAA